MPPITQPEVPVTIEGSIETNEHVSFGKAPAKLTYSDLRPVHLSRDYIRAKASDPLVTKTNIIIEYPQSVFSLHPAFSTNQIDKLILSGWLK